MKAIDFLEEWNRTHTSCPSIQDALDWAEKEHSIEMKEQNAEWIMTLGVQKQAIINKACKWLKERVQCGVHPQRAYGFAEEFRKAMQNE